MSEKAKPGEWWVNKYGKRMYVAGTTADGKFVLEFSSGGVYIDHGDWAGCRRLVECTGWEWAEPVVLDARGVLEKLAMEVGVDPLGVDSADLAEMIVLANKKREQHGCRQMPPEFTGREKDLLEAIANLRDNIDRLATRVVNLEQRTMPYQTIGGSVR